MKTDKWILVVNSDDGPIATLHANIGLLERATVNELFFGELTAKDEQCAIVILAALHETGRWDDEDAWVRWYSLWENTISQYNPVELCNRPETATTLPLALAAAVNALPKEPR